MRLDQVTVGSIDLDRSEAFYRTLGLTLIVKDEHYLRFECPEGESTFSVELVGSLPEFEQVTVYFETDDLDGACQRLRADGIEFEQAPADMPGCGGRAGCATRTGTGCASSTPGRTVATLRGGCEARDEQE